MDRDHQLARIAATWMTSAALLATLALMTSCKDLVLPTDSCANGLEFGLDATRNPNVFQVNLGCDSSPTQECLTRQVEIYVDQALQRGTYRHGDALELWCYCELPYNVWARDLACISPPLQIVVEGGVGGPNGEACFNLPVGAAACR